MFARMISCTYILYYYVIANMDLDSTCVLYCLSFICVETFLLNFCISNLGIVEYTYSLVYSLPTGMCSVWTIVSCKLDRSHVCMDLTYIYKLFIVYIISISGYKIIYGCVKCIILVKNLLGGPLL